MSGEILRLNLHINEDNLDELLKKVCLSTRSWWQLENIVTKRLIGGGVNLLYHCHLKDDENIDDAVVIRIMVLKKEKEDIYKEEMGLRLGEITECGMSICAAFNNGFVIGYNKGRLLTWNELWDEHKSRLVMQCLARLHAVDIDKLSLEDPEGKPFTSKKEPCIFHRMRKFVNALPQSLKNRPEKNKRYQSEVPSRDVLATEICTLEDHIKQLKLDTGFCHNDVWVNNLMYDEQKDMVYLVDFEYADFNIDGFDLASLFGCFHITNRVEEMGLNDEMNTHDFLQRSNVDFPDEKKEMWLREYLEYRNMLESKTNAVVTDKHVKYLHAKLKILAILSGFYSSLLTLSICDHPSPSIDLFEFSMLRLRVYYKLRDHLFSISLPSLDECVD